MKKCLRKGEARIIMPSANDSKLKGANKMNEEGVRGREYVSWFI